MILFSDVNKNLYVEFKNYLNILMNRGKSEGLIKDADNNILIALIIGFVRNFSFHVVHDCKGELSDDLIDNSFTICWDAIRK